MVKTQYLQWNLVNFITMLRHSIFGTRGTHDLSPGREGWYCKGNESEQKVCQPIQLYQGLPFTAVLYAAANLNKTSVKFWHVVSLPRQNLDK